MNFRLRDYILYPLAIKRHHQLLKEAEYWSLEKRRAWTQERLDQVLRYAIKHVPYYKRTLSPFESQFNGMIDRLDFTELPVITKDIIRQHYKELIAENSSKARGRVDRTSGSTGAPMQFMLDSRSDITNFAAIWRVLNWTGYSFGNRYASLDTTFEKETNRLYLYDFKKNCLHIPFVNFKKNQIKEYVNALQKHNPVVLKSYPSSLALFAHAMLEAGINNYRPKAILTCAETLLDHQKKILSDVLQCPMFDFYGQNERACLISTCKEGRYHIHEEYSFVELVPENNQPLIAGESAHIVATTFDNFVMPLIRYETHDMAILDNSLPCECKRTYKTVEKILGRSEDVIFTPEGRQVTRMDVPFKYSPGIQEAQIIQRQIDKIQVNMVRSANFQQKDIDTLAHHLHLRLGDHMNIEFNFVEAIPLGKNGKRKFIISEMNKEPIVFKQQNRMTSVV